MAESEQTTETLTVDRLSRHIEALSEINVEYLMDYIFFYTSRNLD